MMGALKSQNGAQNRRATESNPDINDMTFE